MGAGEADEQEMEKVSELCIVAWFIMRLFKWASTSMGNHD